MPRALIALAAASMLLGGCASILRQELQTRIGPCRREMSYWRDQYGPPSETESEEDGDFYTVDWIYPDRGDTVIRFQWEAGDDECQVRRTVGRR